MIPATLKTTMRGPAAANGLATLVSYQIAAGTRYFDAAGFAQRSLGLPQPAATASR